MTVHWKPAIWEDYERYRDDPEMSKGLRLFFHDGYLKVNPLGWIEYPEVNQLFTMLIGVWFMAHPKQIAQSMGGCLMEKPKLQAATPDLMLYVGEAAPGWSEEKTCWIDLEKWRVPDLGRCRIRPWRVVWMR
jgi:hypothetical protein